MAVHPTSRHLQPERGSRPEELYAVRHGAAYLAKAGKKYFAWLEPPAPPSGLTVLHVRDAQDPDEHAKRVREWARSVWEAWSPHHATVRRWAEPPRRSRPAG